MKSIRLITTNAGEWGGSELLWQQAARRLREQGHRVQVAVPSRPYERYRARLANLRADGISVRRWRNFHSKKLTRLQGGLRQLQRLFPAGGGNSPSIDLNVVSQGSLRSGLATLQRLNAMGQRVVVVIQLVAENLWPNDLDALSLATEFRKAKLICFVSENNLQLAEQQLGPISNAMVVRNPFLVPYNSAPSFPSTSQGYLLASVARLDVFHKGLDLLIRVLDSEKWKSRELSVQLFGDGPNRGCLQRDIERRGLQHKIVLRGHQQDVAEIWRECHGLILCSRIEGLPLSLVEAMLRARCPIVTNVGGAEEIVDDESTGFLAKAATIHDIDDALERAWQRRSEWQQLGLAAAIKARATVPEDPATVFAEQLLRLCD